MEINELVVRAKDGDVGALEILIERLAPIRRAVCARFPALSSEDLDQDLVVLLIDSLGEYVDERSNFSWFIKQRSQFYALDLAKKRKRELEMSYSVSDDEVYVWEGISDGVMVEDVFEELQWSRELMRAIGMLDSVERYVIYFYYYRGKTLREIGEDLGRSASWVSKVKSKGVRKLKNSEKLKV